MSIFKDTFRNYVRDQLAVREELIDLGNTNDQGVRSVRRNLNPVTLQNGKSTRIDISPDAYYNYTLSKQCVIRMTSLVDYVSDVNLEIGGYGRPGDAGFERLKGASLSQNFILEGGVLSDFARNINGEKILKRATTPRESFPKPGLKTNLGYGDFGIGADADPDGFGIVPMPGIIDADIRTKSAYGSLREAKVNFECHNRRQLEILEMLYMRPGYNVLLEWGWAPYISNTGKIRSNLRLVEDKLKINGTDESLIYTNDITQQIVFNAINDLKEEAGGNYDGFLGFVKNFGFQAREDGGYSCYTEMVSIGEVMESIKIGNVSTFNPLITNNLSEGGSTEDSDIASKIVIEKTEKVRKQTNNTGNNYTATVSGDDETITSVVVDAQQFNEAFEKGVFPQYNGLEGLTKSLKNYATFNSFTLNTNNLAQSDIFSDNLNEIYPEYDENYNLHYVSTWEGMFSSEESNEEKRENLEKISKLNENLGLDSGADFTTRQNRLRDLLRFQAETIQAVLLKKLNLSSAEELRNYIIPRGGTITGDEKLPSGATYKKESIGLFRNDQPYIRWDALTILINDALIPKNETLKNPINIIADRIYDLDGKESKLDPLKFVSITNYNEETDQREVIDFSTDPNICILPLQFSKGEGSIVESQLGYLPDLNIFPKAYTEAIYDKTNRGITYDDLPLSNSTRLIEDDKNRRIGNIFLNINMIDDIATQNADNKDYTVGNFIVDIWNKVNQACSNHNFVLTDDKESNNVFIIDLPVDKGEIPKDLHTFIPFSNKNILRQFSYTSNVPSALSSTIAIQAQDPRSIQDIDGVTFAAFNRSIKNRIQSKDITPTWEKTKNDIRSQASQLKRKRKRLREKLKLFQTQFFKNLSAKRQGRDLLGGNISGILKDYQANSTYISEALDKDSTFASVIPLEFSATLDGISGIVIGNMFKIKKDRLPRAYAKTNIGFIVFNEEQKITAGGDWTTDISGKMTILPSPKVNLKTIYSDLDPQPEAEAATAAAIAEAQINELSLVTIRPLSGPGPEGSFLIRIEQPLIGGIRRNLGFEPASSFSQNEFGATVEAIIPNRVEGGFIGNGIYEFTISNAALQFSMIGGQPIQEYVTAIPTATYVVFEENKITIETANIQIPTADPDAWQNYNPTQVEADVNEYLDTYSRGNLTEGGLFRNEDNTVSVKPGPPLTIELNSGNAGYTSIIHTDNTRLNLDPSAANIFTG